ncbi:uncharacterized protein LOC109850035 [Asparagus officinalis]|uniref:uncharacterized protein LOC109850035 n=1 Tax=Asparagus officinalis TaxID=4686 RepID=UPI00098E1FEC|nr:uncharacterized protein LOC109850035 [Asparagus officinalis]
MDSTRFRVGLVTILVATLWVSSSAQYSSCASALINLSPCRNYITGNGGGLRSAPTAPSSVSPSVPATPSGYGSQTIPTGGLRSSNGSSLRITFSICFSLLFIVIYLSAPLNSL